MRQRGGRPFARRMSVLSRRRAGVALDGAGVGLPGSRAPVCSHCRRAFAAALVVRQTAVWWHTVVIPDLIPIPFPVCPQPLAI